MRKKIDAPKDGYPCFFIVGEVCTQALWIGTYFAEMKAEFPNLFLVGAPKSGTTTLHFWLNCHPKVFMSDNKEPRYFCGFPSDAAYLPNRSGFVQNLITKEADYAALFAQANKEKWVG